MRVPPGRGRNAHNGSCTDSLPSPPTLQSTVGENRWLQGQLVQSLLRHCDACGAARWAQRCQVPPEMLPQAVAEELQKLHIQDR